MAVFAVCYYEGDLKCTAWVEAHRINSWQNGTVTFVDETNEFLAGYNNVIYAFVVAINGEELDVVQEPAVQD